MLAQVALLATQSFGAVAGPSDAACRAAIAQEIAGSPASVVPGACWRVGPLRLGMTGDEVEQRLGAPVERATVAGGDQGQPAYEVRIFAFPRDWSAQARHPARLRFLEVLLAQDHVVRIDNDPGSVVRDGACAGADRAPRIDMGGEPAGFQPFQVFAGVPVGAPTSDLASRFGRAPASNRPHDWRSYLPVPITFDADPATGRITGFAIAADEASATTAAPVEMTIVRDHQTCRYLGLAFGTEARRP
jgi:hypothetical protein